MTLWDFVQLTAQVAYAQIMGAVGNWWPLGIAIGAVILMVVGYRKSSIRIPWAQLGRIAVYVLLGAVVACWLIFGVIALGPVLVLVVVIAGLIAAFAWLFRWLDGRQQSRALPDPWSCDRMVGVLTTDEKRALLAWAEEHQGSEDMPEASDEGLLNDRQIAYLSYVRHWRGVKEDTALMWGEVKEREQA